MGAAQTKTIVWSTLLKTVLEIFTLPWIAVRKYSLSPK